MNLRRILKWSFLSATALVVLLAIAALTLDLGFLRGVLEKQVSQATGRTLSIHGDFSLHLGSVIVIEAHDLKLANAEWAEAPDMLTLQRIRAEIDAASLWRGTPLISQLEIDGLVAALLKDKDGRANWEMKAPPTKGADSSGEPVVLLQHAQVSDVTFSLDTPRLQKTLRGHIEQFDQTLDSQGRVQASLQGTLTGHPVELTAALSPWERLARGDDIELKVDAFIDQATFSLAGKFDNIWSPSRPELTLTAKAASLDKLSRALAIDGLGDGEVAIKMTTRPSGSNLSVNADVALGAFHLDLKGELPNLDNVSGLALNVDGSGPNFAALARLAGLEDWPEERFSVSAQVQRPNGGLLIEQMDLKLAGARMKLAGNIPGFPEFIGAELSLDIEGTNLAAFSGATGLSLLSPGAFSIDGSVATPTADHTTFDLNLSLPSGSGQVNGKLYGDQSLELNMDLAGPDLAQFSGIEGVGTLPPGPWKIEGQMTTANDAAFDFQVDTPIGKGRANGHFHDASDYDLVLTVGGQNALRAASFFGLPWLPARPWQLDLSAAQSDPAMLTLTRFNLTSEGLQLEARGSVGTEPLQTGTDLMFTLEGPRLASFQEFAPQMLTLPAVDFGATGHISVRDNALQLAPLKLRIGDNHYNLDGAISLAESREGTRISLDAEGKDIGRLFDLPGAARLPDGPFSSQGIASLVANQLKIDSFRLSAGSLELALDAVIPWPLGFARGQVSFVGSGDDITQVLPELLDIQFDSTSFELDFAARWDEEEIEFSKGQLRVGSSTLGVSGAIDLPPRLSTTDLTVTASAPDLSRLGTIDGKRWGKVPFELETRLAGNTKTFELSSLRIRLGEADISGTFKADLTPPTPELDLRLSTNVLNLRPFLGEKQRGSSPAANPNPDRRLIPDTALPLDVLKRVNGNFAIAADRLLLRRSTLINALVSGQLREGRLAVNELGTDTHGGRLAATLELEPRAAHGDASLSVGIHSKNLILDFSDTPDDAKSAMPPFDVDIDLKGTGATVRELAASLNGKLLVSSPGGIITNPNGFNQRSPFLVQVISAISPMTFQQPQVEIACIAAVGKVDQGKVLLEPGLAIQSKRLNLLAFGTVDLGTEKLDVRFNAHTRRAVDITAGDLLSPYVTLGGTLAEPDIGVDPKSTLISGGAAVLSGGLTILAKKALEQLAGTDDACARILEQGGQNIAQP